MSTTEKHHFQAEIQQLLDIVIHSLYTDKEIFVRELISNAADACEKLRFLKVPGRPILTPELALGIAITTDEKEGTITFTDTGIGMTHGELVENLGTIAHSGTKASSNNWPRRSGLTPISSASSASGFYSAFMVASKVTVSSRSAIARGTGLALDQRRRRRLRARTGGRSAPRNQHRRCNSRTTPRIRQSRRDRADHQALLELRPVSPSSSMASASTPCKPSGPASQRDQRRGVQRVLPIFGHDHENPLYRLHFTSDAPLAIQALLFVPPRNFETLGMAQDRIRGATSTAAKS